MQVVVLQPYSLGRLVSPAVALAATESPMCLFDGPASLAFIKPKK
jgi:hypothetical protein